MIAAVWQILPIWLLSAGEEPPKIAQPVREAALLATLHIEGSVLKSDRKSVISAGSGVAIGSKDGRCYALTAWHVVAKADFIEVSAQVDGETETFTGVKVLARLPEPDLALLEFRVGESIVSCLRIAAKSEELKRFPLPVLNSGWVNKDNDPTCEDDLAEARKFVILFRKKGDSIGKAFFWQTQKPPTEGRSGGPLISANGELVGICSLTGEEKGFYGHLDEIHYLIRKHSSCQWLLPKQDQP